ncbi:MAG: alpha-glucosidase [Leptospiraceae bacterium]|nr:alpha-glucosidase [Leptospiraceae bacterium]
MHTQNILPNLCKRGSILLCAGLWLAIVPISCTGQHSSASFALKDASLSGGSAQSGNFQISLTKLADEPLLQIVYNNGQDESDAKIIWQSVPGESFVNGAFGKENVRETRGSFFIKDHLEARCERQVLSSLEQDGRQIRLQGYLECNTPQGRHPWELVFASNNEEQLEWDLKIHGLNRTYISFQSPADEAIFGFGEQFSYFNMKGRDLPIFVMEQGIGRGDQPITAGADLMADSGGDWHTSYAGVPHFMTNALRSLWLENTEYSRFNMTKNDRIIITVFAGHVRGRMATAASPLDLIENYTRYSGRMRALPDWIHRGAVIGLQGGTAKVRDVYTRLKNAKVPISALWLQDWEGQRKTSFGKQLWWNWELDKDHYPGWRQLLGDLQQDGVSVLTYMNPFLADVSAKANARRNLFQEAKEKGYLIRNAEGSEYMILNTSFSAGLLDLTNPDARRWARQIIRENLIGSGARGWMADFGEALPYDARLHQNHPRHYHNQYPVEWARINREAIQEAGRGDDIVFFSRSGFTRSPGYSTLFWLGDQMVSFDRHDGIKTAVTGLLSSGISGYSLNHSDTGGYTTINNPIKDYHRSRELLMRWTELSTFNLLLRTHEGNRPEENQQIYSDPEMIQFFARMAGLYAALFDYRKGLIQEAARKGWPVVRHPWLHYPGDHRLLTINYEQFMLGPDIMVAPVLDADTDEVQLQLPADQWIHLWTGQEFGSADRSEQVLIEAPLGKPAVFYRKGSAVGQSLSAYLRGNKLSDPDAQ